MPGYKIHLTGSTVCGLAYGAAAYTLYDIPLESCGVAAGLCAISGMLPDLDSGPGVPRRESLHFAAAVVPMLMVRRLANLGLTHDSIVMAGAMLFFFIRFGLREVLDKCTIHRGMFHSLPACLISGELAFLICESSTSEIRYLKSGGVMLGFMSHLVLDEIWSIEFSKLSLKSSFGTAIKFWGPTMVPNLITYAMVGALTYVVIEDPTAVQDYRQRMRGGQPTRQIAEQDMPQIAEQPTKPDDVRR